MRYVIAAFVTIAACHANCGDSSEEGSPQPISAPAVDDAGATLGIPHAPRRVHLRPQIAAPGPSATTSTTDTD